MAQEESVGLLGALEVNGDVFFSYRQVLRFGGGDRVVCGLLCEARRSRHYLAAGAMGRG
jgi:hypothetical protein